MNQMAGGMGAPSSDQTGIHSDSLPSTLWEFLYMMSHKTISSWQGALFVKQMLNVFFYNQIVTSSNMNLLWAYLFPCL